MGRMRLPSHLHGGTHFFSPVTFTLPRMPTHHHPPSATAVGNEKKRQRSVRWVCVVNVFSPSCSVQGVHQAKGVLAQAQVNDQAHPGHLHLRETRADIVDEGHAGPRAAATGATTATSSLADVLGLLALHRLGVVQQLARQLRRRTARAETCRVPKNKVRSLSLSLSTFFLISLLVSLELS